MKKALISSKLNPNNVEKQKYYSQTLWDTFGSCSWSRTSSEADDKFSQKKSHWFDRVSLQSLSHEGENRWFLKHSWNISKLSTLRWIFHSHILGNPIETQRGFIENNDGGTRTGQSNSNEGRTSSRDFRWKVCCTKWEGVCNMEQFDHVVHYKYFKTCKETTGWVFASFVLVHRKKKKPSCN